MTSKAVNRPTNVEQKQQDVNQKLQLYGIFSAFSNGKVPSNEQIDVALNSFKDATFMKTPSKKLSTEGQALVRDFRDVVEQAQHMLLSKNDGNLLQDFIWQTQKIDGADAGVPGAPISKDRAQQHGNEALEGLRTLGTLLVSNGQFRKLLSDASILIRDIAGDAATNAASSINPSEDQLKQIDRPADDNTWHEVPNLSPGNIRAQAKDAINKNTPLSKKDLQDAAGDATQSGHPSGTRDPEAAARSQADKGTASDLDPRSAAHAGINTLKDRASDNVDDKDKDRAKDAAETAKNKTKNYLSSKMPEERREQTIWRLKKMVVEIQGHSDYQSAINTLLNLAEEYAGHATTIASESVGNVQAAHKDSSLQLAEKDLKTLVERFANGTSTNDLFDSINTIYRDADRDPELKSWFKNIDAYVRKALKEQGYIMEDSATEEWNALYDQGNFLLRTRYRNHTDRIVDEIKFLADQFDKDPLNRKFADSCQKLFNDLGNDENGKPTFKPHLVKDLTEVIIPAVFENVRYVPIPRIEYSDPMIDAVVENLVIESDNLLPNAVEFASDNYWRWGRKNIANRNKNAVMFSITGVQMDLRDVSYYVKKKQGFPGVKDTGVADIFLGGSGFSFKIKMSTADPKDRQHFFKIDKVDVDVKNANIKLKKSNHKFLFALVKPLMLGVMRPALQKVLEKVIKEKFAELDALIYSVKKEADRAMEEAKQDPEKAQNIYERYVTAFQNKVLKAQKKAEDVKENTKVNVAVTQHDSIFPEIKLPGGISSKATEYKELAAKGDKWESPIFSIGSASKSATIPSAPAVTRKEHEVTSGGVKGPQNIGHTTPITASTGVATNGTATSTNGTAKTTAPVTTAPATTTAFSTQVDQAFSKPTNGTTGTTLGSNNPVLTGTAGPST